MKNAHFATMSLFIATLLLSPPVSAAADKAMIIGFHQKPGVSEDALIREHGGKIKRQFKHVRAMAAILSEQSREKLKKNPKVAYMEEDLPVMAVDPELGGIEYDNAWGVAHIGAAQAHAQGITGAGVKVAVIDSGIDYNHPELAANFKGGVNFITESDSFDDSWNSHGTHVAGIIAAVLNDTGVVGVAPEAELYAVKVLGGDGFGSTSALIAGIEWAATNGMDIANISIGSSVYSQAVADACQAAADAGVLLVAAAGNNYGNPVMYPARLDTVIAVTAIGATDENYFNSALGPEVELAAPGVGINSTIGGDTYNIMTGTSQAAPHVAGAAALIFSAGASDLNGDGITDARDVRLQLQRTANDLGVFGRDETYGFGMVRVAPASSTPPERLLRVERIKGPPSDSTTTIPLANGLFEIMISNDSLRNLDVKSYRDGVLVPELSTSIRFNYKNPSEVTLMIDASTSPLEVALLPKGTRGAFANILIQKVIVQ